MPPKCGDPYLRMKKETNFKFYIQALIKFLNVFCVTLKYICVFMVYLNL